MDLDEGDEVLSFDDDDDEAELLCGDDIDDGDDSDAPSGGILRLVADTGGGGAWCQPLQSVLRLIVSVGVRLVYLWE